MGLIHRVSKLEKQIEAHKSKRRFVMGDAMTTWVLSCGIIGVMVDLTITLNVINFKRKMRATMSILSAIAGGFAVGVAVGAVVAYGISRIVGTPNCMGVIAILIIVLMILFGGGGKAGGIILIIFDD